MYYVNLSILADVSASLVLCEYWDSAFKQEAISSFQILIRCKITIYDYIEAYLLLNYLQSIR
jgi:hypothetical protein